MKYVLAALAALAVFFLSQDAQAVSVIGTGVTTQITDTETDMTTIGGLIIGLSALAMGIRWVKAQFF